MNEQRIAERVAKSVIARKTRRYFDLQIEIDENLSESFTEEIDLDEMEKAVSKVVTKAVGANRVVIQPG
jgi:hypothetical protein